MITRLLTVLTIVTAAATFLLQLLFHSKIIAILPFLIMATSTILYFDRKTQIVSMKNKSKLMNEIIFIYAVLIFFKIIINGFEKNSIISIFEDSFNYLFPISFYYYFRLASRHSQGENLLIAFIIAGIYSGIFFAYDALYRVFAHAVPGFSKMAYQYSMDMMGVTENQMNGVRISPVSRAMGIMVSHSLSATWISIGGFAAFTWFQGKFYKLILIITLSFLFVGLNFTGILAFLIVTFLCYNETLFVTGKKLIISKRAFSEKKRLLIIVAGILALIILTSGAMGELIIRIVLSQTSFIFNKSYGLEHSFFGLTIENTFKYFNLLLNNSLSLFFGIIPSRNSTWLVGGDTGLLDSISFLGLPGWIILIFLFFISFNKIDKYRINSEVHKGIISEEGRSRFVVSVFLFFIIMDLHYNVWMNKSIQIALFSILGYGSLKLKRRKDDL